MQEKRILYALIISFLFLFGYSAIIAKFFPPEPKPSDIEKQEVLSTTPQQQEKTILEEKEFIEKEEQLQQATIGEFIITFSTTGGYISSLQPRKYQETLLYKNIGIVDKDKDKEFKANIREDRIIFKGPGNTTKEYIFEGYTIKIKTTPTPSSMVLFSNDLIPSMLEQRYQQVFYSQKDELVRKALKKVKQGSLDNIEFIGARDRYFCISLIKGQYNHLEWITENKKVYILLAPALKETILYVGPQIKKNLQPFGLEGVMHYGFFHVIGMLLMKLLYFFYFLTKNWGISVILLATSVYCVLFPFTMKSTKAMKRMQELQPHIEELKQKHKDNPQKMNKEMLELYRKYKINPLGGCLPLFFQFPVFIALYQVLLRAIELKGAHFLWIKDLSLPDHAFKLPMTLPFLGEYINLLPIFIVIISLFQQKFTTASGSGDQKKMGLFFAVFIGVIFYKFPACLVLYWFVQNLATFLYQLRLSRN